MNKKIAIFCGGPSSEHEVSLNSARTIYQSIDKNKYEVAICYISKENNARILKSEPANFDNITTTTPIIEVLKQVKKEGWFAFLGGIHGEFAEDGTLQALLEYEKIPYSGSTEEASALCTDKMRSMLIANSIGLNIPQSFFLEVPYDIKLAPEISYPAILKPNNLGSSVGLFIVHDKNELTQKAKHLQEKNNVDEILVQEFIHGIELSCGVLQDRKGSFTFLPPIEIHPAKNELFDYKAKYSVGGSEEITPPISISKRQADEISELTAKIHIALGCKTYSRSDFIVKDGKIYYLETNTLPGMTQTSLLPKEANAAGISFQKLLDFIIENS